MKVFVFAGLEVAATEPGLGVAGGELKSTETAVVKRPVGRPRKKPLHLESGKLVSFSIITYIIVCIKGPLFNLSSYNWSSHNFHDKIPFFPTQSVSHRRAVGSLKTR